MMSDKEANDADELEFGAPLPLGAKPPTPLEELNALFSRGFTVPPSLRMNSYYGKFAVRAVEAAPDAIGHRVTNGDWVVPYVFDNLRNVRRLFKIAEDEVRIIRGEARVI